MPPSAARPIKCFDTPIGASYNIGTIKKLTPGRFLPGVCPGELHCSDGLFTSDQLVAGLAGFLPYITMKRTALLAIPIASVFAAPFAKAQTWNAAVLYPLNLPSGFSSGQTIGVAQIAAEGQVVGYGNNGSDNALLWSAPSGTASNFSPTNLSGFSSSYGYGTNGSQQVGYGFGSGTSNNAHALLWNNSASSAIDLNPTNLAGFSASYAYATDGSQQVGFGVGTGTGNNNHALLWNGSASTAVDLNPTSVSGISNSFANGLDATQEVGYGYGTGTGNNSHALLWNGTAATAVDLNPTNLTGITSSSANAVAGAEEVGYGLGSGTANDDHAMLWTGSASSAVDLNPTNLSGISSSVAYGTNGSVEVGYGFGSGTSNNSHAILWQGTAGSATDLQSLLPSAGNWVFSQAYTIDASGNAFGVAYGTYNGSTGSFAVEWNEVAPPQTLTWNNSGGASPSDGQTWDIGTNNNWTNASSAVVAYSDPSNVIFNDQNNGNYAVTLNTTVSPSLITVNNSAGDYTISGSGSIAGNGSLTKSGSGTLTLGTKNSYSGGTTVNAGTVVVAVNGALPNGAATLTGGTLQLAMGTGLAKVTSLAISGNGTLDIVNNHLIINYGKGPDPIASIAALISSGYAGGSWSGTGITSTAAAANSGSYGIGYADSADLGNPAGLGSGQIEIMYTLLGDANLDGKVNGADFAILATNFNKAVTGVSGWDQGDFNYDGKINGADFAALASDFNQGASQSSIAVVDAFAAANGLSLPTSVPEPACGVLAMAGGSLILARRKRSTSR